MRIETTVAVGAWLTPVHATPIGMELGDSNLEWEFGPRDPSTTDVGICRCDGMPGVLHWPLDVPDPDNPGGPNLYDADLTGKQCIQDLLDVDNTDAQADCCLFVMTWVECLGSVTCGVNGEAYLTPARELCAGWSTMWRVTNAESMTEPWVVWSLTFYSDHSWRQPIAVAEEHRVSSQAYGPHLAVNAFDSDASTEWLSLCGITPPMCLKGQAHIGMHRTSGAPFRVKSVSIVHGSGDGWMPDKIQVQFYDGVEWQYWATLSDLALPGTARVEQLRNFQSCTHLPATTNYNYRGLRESGQHLHHGGRLEYQCAAGWAISDVARQIVTCDMGIWLPEIDQIQCPMPEGAIKFGIRINSLELDIPWYLYGIMFCANVACTEKTFPEFGMTTWQNKHSRMLPFADNIHIDITPMRSQLLQFDTQTFEDAATMNMQEFVVVLAGQEPRAYANIRFKYASPRNWIPFTAWAEVWDGQKWYITHEETQYAGGKTRLWNMILPGCMEWVPTPGSGMEVKHSDISVARGSQRLIDCMDGWSAIEGGPQTTTCFATGASSDSSIWSPTDLICAMDCPQSIPNLAIQYEARGASTKPRGTRQLDCAPGHHELD